MNVGSTFACSLYLVPVWVQGFSSAADEAPAQKACHYVYYSNEAEKALLENQLAALQKHGSGAWNWVMLPNSLRTNDDVRLHAMAIRHEISQTPCVVLVNSEGIAYARLTLAKFNTKDYDKAKKKSQLSPLALRHHQNLLLHAQLYELFASLCMNEPQDAEIEEAIRFCQQEIAKESQSHYMRQLVGLRFLYPLLMLRYHRSYWGGHHAQSELYFLEAIQALEAARDWDKLSSLGRQAHAEREELRRSRLKAMRYD